MTVDDFIRSLSDLTGTLVEDDAPPIYAELESALRKLDTLDASAVAKLLAARPEWLGPLANGVGLSGEQLKNQLKFRFATSSGPLAIRRDARGVADWLCEKRGLLSSLTADLDKTWSFADVMYERVKWTSRSAGSSIQRGRSLENAVESIVQGSSLPYKMRTTFVGSRGRIAPCDFAIPAGGSEAKIVGAVKVFNSTGSKLTDAVREIAELADTRLPRQFVFAVVDGLGWLNRRRDLSRIVDLYSSHAIDGLYAQSTLKAFSVDLQQAAERLGLKP